MAIAAHWTDDCQGKQDFDGHIVAICTRYWPRGGGYMVFDTRTGVFEENEHRPQIKPSAHASIVLSDAEDDHNTVLAEMTCEAETEAEVKATVEQWANDWQQRIADVLRREFPPAQSPRTAPKPTE